MAAAKTSRQSAKPVGAKPARALGGSRPPENGSRRRRPAADPRQPTSKVTGKVGRRQRKAAETKGRRG